MVAGMLMPLRDLRAIYEILFRDGVMVAKKDKRPQTKHPEIEGVSNLQVIRAMGSLKSRGFVKETFAWRHFYWYLTNEGIVYLREHLHLPPEIVPASLQRVRKPAATLAIAHRAARVQSVEGPTSYVPKPGRRVEAESQEALAERHGYRHKMMGPGESERFIDRAPKFRGRPLAAEPVRPKASWEVAEQQQSMFRKGDGLRSEAAVMEERLIKRASSKQRDVSSEKTAIKSLERKVSEIQMEKASQVQPAESKLNVSQMTFASLSPKTGRPLSVDAVNEAAATPAPASNVSSEPAQQEVKIIDDQSFIKSSEVATSKSVISSLPIKDLKEEKMKKVAVEPVSQKCIVDPVKVEIKSNAEKASDKKAHTSTGVASSVITKDVKEEKLQKDRVKVSTKLMETKASGESQNDQEKVKQTAKISVTQETINPPDTTPTEEVLPAVDMKKFSVVKMSREPEMTSVIISAKSQSGKVPQKTMVDKSSIVEVKSTETNFPSPAGAEDKGPTSEKAVITQVITKKEESLVKAIPRVNIKNEKNVPEEVPKLSVEGDKLDIAPTQLSKSTVTMEVFKENKHVVEGTSKSKKKKRKSPGEATEKEKLSTDKPPEELAEKSLQIIPQTTSQTSLVCTSANTEKTSHVSDSQTVVEMAIDGRRIHELSHEKPVIKDSEQPAKPLSSEVIPIVPPVDLPSGAAVQKQVEVTVVSEKPKRPVCPEDKLNIELPRVEPVKSEELAVTSVEKVLVQKITKVQLIEGSHDTEEKSHSALPQSQDLTLTRKHAEEPTKSKKKGKAKKQTREPVAEPVNAKVDAGALSPAHITSRPEDKVTGCPVKASVLGEASLPSEMTPEIICSEETTQAAAVLAEAPADKREAEPALPSAEKIKREVPKPETSCAERETYTATESAAPVAATHAAGAQASPLAEQEEPPKVAQHSASEAAECSTGKSLSTPEASKPEEAKKRDGKDTPSTCVTATAACSHLGHTPESISSGTDEAAMKKKIVVVEEIVEVKQIIGPHAAEEQTPPTPVKPEEEAEELDLDVLEALAIERALLSGAAGAQAQGASPDDEWDHSLQEPEEKTWPNFIEGWFEHIQSPSCFSPAVFEIVALSCGLCVLFQLWAVLGICLCVNSCSSTFLCCQTVL